MNAVPKTTPSQNADRSRPAPVASRVTPATANGSSTTQWKGSNDSPAATPASAASALRASSLTGPPGSPWGERVAPNLLGARTRKEPGPFGPTSPPLGVADGAVVYWAPDSCSRAIPPSPRRPPGTASAWFVVPDTRSRGHLDVST